MAKRMNAQKPAAKRGKAAAAADDSHDDEEFGKIDALPTGDDIKAHIKSLSGLKAKIATLTGEVGAEVKYAESEKNIHRGAAGFMLKLSRMDEEKRDEFLRHFDSYRLQLGFGRQADLFNDDAPEQVAGGPAH